MRSYASSLFGDVGADAKRPRTNDRGEKHAIRAVAPVVKSWVAPVVKSWELLSLRTSHYEPLRATTSHYEPATTRASHYEPGLSVGPMGNRKKRAHGPEIAAKKAARSAWRSAPFQLAN